MKRLLGSLAGRLTLAAVAAVAVALVIAGVAVAISAERADRAALDRDLERAATRGLAPARRIIGIPGPPPDGARDGPRPQFRRRLERAPDSAEAPFEARLEPEPDRFVRIVEPERGVLITAGGRVPSRFPVVEPPDPQTVSAGGERWRTVSRPIGPHGEVVQAAGRLDPLEDRANRLRLLITLAVLGALALTALLARWLVRTALEPLAGLRVAAGRIASSGDPTERMPRGEGPEEVEELAADLDQMLERLDRVAGEREQALEAARRFAADAGHELRTPLTSLQANLGAAARGSGEALAAADSDTQRLSGLVAQLQALARGEAGAPLRRERVELAELAEAAVASLRARHPDLSAELQVEGEIPTFEGDRDGLAMLLDNLLENAAIHGKTEGRIAVALAVRDADVELTVDDDGPGIPAEERANVTERFVRGAGAQGPGTGLGLAIAAAQAERHGGSLELEDSPLGGLRVRVRLAPS